MSEISGWGQHQQDSWVTRRGVVYIRKVGKVCDVGTVQDYTHFFLYCEEFTVDRGRLLDMTENIEKAEMWVESGEIKCIPGQVLIGSTYDEEVLVRKDRVAMGNCSVLNWWERRKYLMFGICWLHVFGTSLPTQSQIV